MSMTTISARELNHKLGEAKKAAKNGPMLITDRGVSTHVLVNIDEYRKITGTGKSLAESLRYPAAAETDLELERMNFEPRPVDPV